MLTWRAAIARRLARHHLLAPAPRSHIVDVVSAMCGVHAQVMPSAVLSLGLRVRGFVASDLDDALWERRELVKIFGIRGTVHIVPAREYGWWLAALRATGEDGRDVDPKRLAYLEMTETQLREMSAVIGDALSGERLTREQLGAAVANRVGRWAIDRTVGAFGGQWPVWQAALGSAALAGDLCFGPPDGARVTFVRPDDWLGRVTVPKPMDALRELFLRYLTAYGPATDRDFAQWSLASPQVVRGIREACGDDVVQIEIDGERMWQIAGDRAPRTRHATTLLLPRFDAYTVGSYPRDVVAPPAIVERAVATGLLPKRSGSGRAFLTGPMPVLVVDGVVSGIWESKRTSRRLALRVQPFVRLDRARRAALDDAVARLGEIVGLSPSLEIGSVTTRPHL